ncbi:hypothetical protein LXL04_028778 [Taraxacum kok-saghyz]
MVVGPTLVTPKVVFPAFSKPFAFDWSRESDCLVARVANSGFGMKERDSKLGLVETRVAWNYLGKGKLALENNLVQGIQCDAILTLLLTNYLNRSMQGGGAQNRPKIGNHEVGAQSDVGAAVGRGDDAKLKETCNGVVWGMCDQGLSKNDLNQGIDNIKQGLMKTNLINYPLQFLHVQIERRGCFKDLWLKNIKTKREHATKVISVRKGAGNQEGTRFKEGEMVVKEEDVLGVAALKGSLELRTIPFQEGADDPNRVSFKSDTDKSRRMMTRMADMAENTGEVGCGETIKVTWHLVKQVWCYFNMKMKLAGIGARVHGDVLLGKD